MARRPHAPVLALVVLLLAASPAAADVLKGTEGDDELNATNGDDRVRALGGNDQVKARAGDDKVWGGAGKDVIDGSQGRDELHGGRGRDVVDAATTDPGGDLFDVAYGDAGDDTIYIRFRDHAFGGTGDDRIEAVYPAAGMAIDCGDGKDEVIFNATPSKAVRTVDCERIRVFSAG